LGRGKVKLQKQQGGPTSICSRIATLRIIEHCLPVKSYLIEARLASPQSAEMQALGGYLLIKNPLFDFT
jgi:hypothetical protein